MNITVGITSYNQRDYLIEAIDSVLAQSTPPAEIIIVDDASSDDSPQIIDAYAARHPDRVRPILLPRNGGPNAARNHVIDAARGDYLAFLDGDDRWRPVLLERLLARLAAPDRPDAAFGNFHVIDAAGHPLFLWATRGAPEGKLLRRVLTLDMPRTTLFRSELVPTALWRAAGPFDASFAIYGDWDMRIRQAQVVGRYGFIDESLCEYRRHDNNRLSDRGLESHLAAVDHVERKYAALIAQLEAEEGSVRRGLARWRAKLMRRAALTLTLQRPPGFRAGALRHYGRSLTYHPTLDARLLWRIAKP
jgi:glycosyltransferase involved in cell wall biosynthesis